MDNLINSIIEQVEKFNESIKETLDSKKISNTGEAANSLRIEYGEDFVDSIGIFYLEFLDTGRGPGKMPPIDSLKDWAKTKYNVSDEDALSIAWGTAIKIKQLGTEIFLNNSKGIELDKKIVALRENLKPVAIEATKLEVKQKLNEFKTAFTKNKYGL